MKHMKASDIMVEDVVTVDRDALLPDVAARMIKHRISGMPVLDDKQTLVGVIASRDLMAYVPSEKFQSTRVADVMVRNVLAFSPDTPLSSIVNSFANRGVGRVPIVEKGTLVGIICRREILAEVLDAG